MNQKLKPFFLSSGPVKWTGSDKKAINRKLACLYDGWNEVCGWLIVNNEFWGFGIQSKILFIYI